MFVKHWMKQLGGPGKMSLCSFQKGAAEKRVGRMPGEGPCFCVQQEPQLLIGSRRNQSCQSCYHMLQIYQGNFSRTPQDREFHKIFSGIFSWQLLRYTTTNPKTLQTWPYVPAAPTTWEAEWGGTLEPRNLSSTWVTQWDSISKKFLFKF